MMRGSLTEAEVMRLEHTIEIVRTYRTERAARTAIHKNNRGGDLLIQHEDGTWSIALIGQLKR